MKKMLLCLLILVFAATGNADEEIHKNPNIQSFKAGGIAIVIPEPTSEMVEVGYDNREFMEIFVPSSNRLLAAFVLSIDLPSLTKDGDNLMISKYALVQVPRRGEYMDYGESEFKTVTDSMKEQFGSVMGSSIKEAEDEFNRRMESLDLNEGSITIGQPIQLGCLFSKQDSYGFGMIAPVSMAGKMTNMGMGAALVRANKRLLFAYLYAEYKNEDTVKWLRKTTEEWADAILKANQ